MNKPSSFALWLQAVRPQTLPAGLGPVVLGLALAHQYQPLDPLTALLTAGCTLLLQISTNLINDYYDGVRGTDNHQRLGPVRVTAAGLIPANTVKRGFLLTLSLAFLCGLYLMSVGGTPIIIIGLASMLCAWAYTGGPFPLSHFALGELFAVLFFGPVAVWGTYFIQIQQFNGPDDHYVRLWGLSIGLIAGALMGINNLRDIEQDRRAHKVTLATLLGAERMRFFIILLVIVGVVLAYTLLEHYPWVIVLPFFIFLKHWRGLLTARGSELNHHLALTGKYLTLFALTAAALLWITPDL